MEGFVQGVGDQRRFWGVEEGRECYAVAEGDEVGGVVDVDCCVVGGLVEEGFVEAGEGG